MYTAPHSAPALPPAAPAPPAPQRGAHRSCPTEREQFLRYCPCPINWNRCCRVYSTSSPLLPIIYCPCPTARDLCRVVYPALFFFGAVTHLVPMTDICLSCLLDPLEPDFTVLYKTINLFLDLNVWEYILVDFYNSHMAATLICA